MHLAFVAIPLLVCLAGVESSRAEVADETSPCTIRQTRSAVSSVVAAFNQGDSEGLEALFAPEPFFRWYSSPGPGRRWIKARQRAALVPYFESRYAHDDKLHLLSQSWADCTALDEFLF